MTKTALEEGLDFTPRFGPDGLMVCIAQDVVTGAVLMVAWMNAEALRATLATRIVHYWSRSRDCLWRKGETSGQIQRVVDIRTDCDQDALLLSVEVEGDGGACHTGRKSCFYRQVVASGANPELRFVRGDRDRCRCGGEPGNRPQNLYVDNLGWIACRQGIYLGQPGFYRAERAEP